MPDQAPGEGAALSEIKTMIRDLGDMACIGCRMNTCPACALAADITNEVHLMLGQGRREGRDEVYSLTRRILESHGFTERGATLGDDLSRALAAARAGAADQLRQAIEALLEKWDAEPHIPGQVRAERYAADLRRVLDEP